MKKRFFLLTDLWFLLPSQNVMPHIEILKFVKITGPYLPGYIDRRAGTTTQFLLGSQLP
jgi:hypothetical protein